MKGRKQHTTQAVPHLDFWYYNLTHPIRIYETILLVRCFPRNPPIHFNFRLIQTRLILLRISTQTKQMVSYMNILLYGVGGLVVAGMALLVAFQEKLVYVPVLPGLTKSYAITPSRLRLTYEDIWLSASDGVRLHAWFIKLFPDTRGLFSFSIFLNFGFHFYELFRSKGNRVLFVVDSMI